MNKRLAELVTLIASEKNPEKKLALIKEMKAVLGEEAERLQQKPQKTSA